METLLDEMEASRPACEAMIADTERFVALLRREDALLKAFLDGVADARREYGPDRRLSRSE